MNAARPRRRLKLHLRTWADGLAERLEAYPAGRAVLEIARASAAVVKGFRGEKISLRASALTYITMLSLVPLLAVAFAVVTALGEDGLRRGVHEYVLAVLAPGTREEVGGYIDKFIARASAKAMGGVGGAFLVISAVSLLHNVERSLNEMWGVTRPRPLLQRALIYWAVLSAGPVLLGMSLLATAALRPMVAGTWLASDVLAFVPMVGTILLLTFLYMAAPNVKVRLRPALVGGVVAGVAWELAKRAYALYAARSFRYSAIYGSLGAVPLFLLWVFVSWLIVLFGARLAFALQTAALSQGRIDLQDPRAREVFCAEVAAIAATDFFAAAEPPQPAHIARRLHVEPFLVRAAVEALIDGGVLAEARRGGVVPARDPEQIAVAEIAAAARGVLWAHRFTAPAQGPERRIWSLFDEADELARGALAACSLGELARRMRGSVAEKERISAG